MAVKTAAAAAAAKAPLVPAGTFGWTHGVIDLPSRDEHRLRFYDDNRYRILEPYTALPNDPWYVPALQRRSHAAGVVPDAIFPVPALHDGDLGAGEAGTAGDLGCCRNGMLSIGAAD